MKKNILSFFLILFLMLPFCVSAQWTLSNPGGLPTGSILGIITNIMNWLLVLLGIIGVIGFVLSGIFYLTAAGDEDRMNMGKNSMKWSIMGIIVGLIGYVVIKAVNTMLGGSSSTF